MCRCRTDALLERGRRFFFSLCSRLLWTLGSFIVFIALPVQNVNLFHALKKDIDLELMHTLKREIIRCWVCCNINAVIFFLYNPLFLLHLITLTGRGCLLRAAIDPSPKMLHRYKFRFTFMVDVILSTYFKHSRDLMLKIILKSLFLHSLRIWVRILQMVKWPYEITGVLSIYRCSSGELMMLQK